METHFNILSVFTFLAFAGATLSAQELTLKDRSVLELNLGFWGGSKVSNTVGTAGIQYTANTSVVSHKFFDLIKAVQYLQSKTKTIHLSFPHAPSGNPCLDSR